MRRKSLSFSLITLFLAILSCFFLPKIEAKASDELIVNFDFNTSRVQYFVPSEILNTLSNYYIEVSAGDFAEETKSVHKNLGSYYTYDWTVDGKVVDLSTYPITKDMTFVASWTPVTYTINYYYLTEKEKSEITNIVYTQNYTIESPSIEYYRPTRAHYDFVDWYSSSTFAIDTIELYRPAGSIGDKLLYARWQPTEYYIDYHTDAKNSNNPTTYNIESPEYILARAEKEGHIFKGWYLDKDLTIPCTKIESGSYGDLDLYPEWELETYTVTYILPNGSTTNVTVEYGKTASLPKSLKTGLFDIVKSDVSRSNITGDTTISLEVVNIWYVYLLVLLLIVVIVVAISVSIKKRKERMSSMRNKYQSSLRLLSDKERENDGRK